MSCRALVSALASVAIFALVSAVAARSDAPTSGVSLAQPCAHGSVAARIAGKNVCLKVGLRCQKRLEAQYRRFGFACRSRRLAKRSSPAKPAPLRIEKPALPAVRALPAAAATVAAPSTLKVDGFGELSASADAIWADALIGIVRLDPATGMFSGPFEPAGGANPAAGPTDVWVPDFDGGVVRRLDAATGRVVATIPLDHPNNVDVTPDAVWVSLHRLGEVARIDPTTNQVIATIKVGPAEHSGPSALTTAFGSVWVTIPNTWSVVRIDATTNKLLAKIQAPFDYAAPGAGIAATTGAVWITPGASAPTTLGRIDPRTNHVVAEVNVRGFAQQPVAIGDNLWLAVNAADPADAAAERTPGYLLELRANDTIAARYALGAGLWSSGAAMGFGALWLSDMLHPRILRVPLDAL